MDLFAKTTIAKALAVLAVSAGLAACSAAAGPVAAGTDTDWSGNLTTGAKFGTVVGQSAAQLPDRLWAQGYGFEGVVACSAPLQARFGCQAGEQFLSFQPVGLDRKGHIYFKLDGDRISQIEWDLKVVPYSDG